MRHEKRRAVSSAPVVGRLLKHREGFGFVRPEGTRGRENDIYLSAEELNGALSGDTVRVEVVSGNRGRKAGRLLDVVERQRTRAIGRYREEGRRTFVEPLSSDLGSAIETMRTPHAKNGQFVKVALPSPGRSRPVAKVLEVLKEGIRPIEEALDVAYANGFSDEFPKGALVEAEACRFEIEPAELARRRDLRALPLVTIDGADARDFDDAVYVEETRGGYRLVVAIADVSHYVRQGSALDREALQRGTSIYFPNMVLPMLPERLSNGVCSLEPDADRLCMVADMVFERQGRTAVCIDADFYPAAMRSRARCVYEDVARLLEGGAVPKLKGLKPQFQRMQALAAALTAMREERGAIDLDLPEARAELDAKGMPVRIARRGRNVAHRIIEEFMLAANEAVARHFSARELPTVYRVHAEPDPEKLHKFLAMAQLQGFSPPPGARLDGKTLGALLKQLEGAPKQRALNALMLRSMMQAIYSGENVGHFGLAAPHYLHFTSPIRRYPDLMVHRLMKERWAASPAPSQAEREAKEAFLTTISEQSSERERAAMEAEREVDAFFAALYMAGKIGEVFAGTVTAVTDFGFFVSLDDENVEGLVRGESLGFGGGLDEPGQQYVLGDGRVFGLGQAVRVQVTRADPSRRQIDLALVEPGRVKPAPQEPETRPSKGRATGGRPRRR